MDWVTILGSGGARAFVYAVTATVDHLLEAHREHEDASDGTRGEFLDDGERTPSLKKRFTANTSRLKRLFALVPTSDEATAIRDDVEFFDAVRQAIAKIEATDRRPGEDAELDTAVRQIISQHVSGGGVIDIFAEAGLDRPDISVIDDEFRKKFEASDQKNLQLEAVRRLTQNEVRIIGQRNVVAGKKFSDMLTAALNRYQNRSITAAQVMAEIVRRDAKTDWNVKETVRAKLRTRIKRLLLKHGYPPDQELAATDLIIHQAEVMAEAGE